MYKYKFSKTSYCGEDEEKTNNKGINQRLFKIEQKLDHILDKESHKISLKDFPRFDKNSGSILKSILDNSLWKRMYMLSTDEGYTINDIIQPGLDNPDHPIGIVALSKDCYFTFDELFLKAAQIIHNRNIELAKHEKESFLLIKNLLPNLEEILLKIINEIVITTNRNVDGYLFSGKISRSDRRELTRNILQVLKTEETNIFEENGKFFAQEGKVSKRDQEEFSKSCGVYRDWPEARYAYANNSSAFNIFVNDEDHLKFLYKADGKSFNVKTLSNYYEMIEKLDEKLNFSYDNNLGYLNSLPSMLGSANVFVIKLNIEKSKKDEFKNHFKNNSMIVINDISDDICEITNSTTFYNLSQFLIELIGIKTIFETPETPENK